MSDPHVQIVLGTVVYAAVLLTFYRRLVASIHAGRPAMSAFMVLLISPISLAFLVSYGENRSLWPLLDLGNTAWSLVIGDVLLLPMAAACAAKANQLRPQFGTPIVTTQFSRWLDSRRCWWQCLAIGLAVGLLFHVNDSNGYIHAGFAALVASLTKLFHDLVIYPVLFGGLLHAAFSTFTYGRGSSWRWMFLACCLGWLVLAIADANRGLSPGLFHAPCGVGCGVDNLLDNYQSLLRWLHIN